MIQHTLKRAECVKATVVPKSVYSAIVLHPDITSLMEIRKHLQNYNISAFSDAEQAWNYAKEMRAKGRPVDLAVIAEEVECIHPETGQNLDGAGFFNALKVKDENLAGLLVSPPDKGSACNAKDGLGHFSEQEFARLQWQGAVNEHFQKVYDARATIGIIGVGKLGSEIMKQLSIALPFDLVDKYFLHTRTPELAEECRQSLKGPIQNKMHLVSLEEAVWRSHIVIVCVSENTTTDLDRMAEFEGNLPHYQKIAENINPNALYIHVSNPPELHRYFNERMVNPGKSISMSPQGLRCEAIMLGLATSDALWTGRVAFENVQVYGPHGDPVPVFSGMKIWDRKRMGTLFTICEADFWADVSRKRSLLIDRDFVRQATIGYPRREKLKYGAVVDMPAQATVDLVKQILRNGEECAGMLCDLGKEEVYAGRGSMEAIVCRKLQFNNYEASLLPLSLDDWEKEKLWEAAERQVKRYSVLGKSIGIDIS